MTFSATLGHAKWMNVYRRFSTKLMWILWYMFSEWFILSHRHSWVRRTRKGCIDDCGFQGASRHPLGCATANQLRIQGQHHSGSRCAFPWTVCLSSPRGSYWRTVRVHVECLPKAHYHTIIVCTVDRMVIASVDGSPIKGVGRKIALGCLVRGGTIIMII